ncbi:MAG: alanine--tRNA ligase [Candidatus Pacebacteria bacterium]|nr:alanine--tRNA ligase [Candidatus Paceibacterota bacterium]
MQSNEIRNRFLKFFEKRGHKIIPSASLVPENDPSVLFNTAGMQPLVPYLLGQDHPMGKRIADVQKCVRTGDLEDIGDNRHFSFFEMMGNWSFGDYFKEDAIKWSYEFLTNGDDKLEGDKGLGLDINRLYVTVFEGDENAPRDTESAEIWKSLGVPENRIYFLGAEDNWWAAGDNGPCGPDTEMFYDMSGAVGDLSKEEFLQAVKNEDVIEIWNDVFMEYEKKDGKVIGKLKQKNVDTGAGLERITAVMQGKKTAYETDLFSSVLDLIKNVAGDKYNDKAARIISDHIRASTFLIADGVIPSNKDQGYVLRRLLRRAVRYADLLSINPVHLSEIIFAFIDTYKQNYPALFEKGEFIKETILEEENKFRKTLEHGLKEFEKGVDPFILATTYGFPIELTLELAKEKGQTINLDEFNTKMAEHQKLSQTASAGMFKGGLANHNEKTIRLHTAHHLLLAGLQTLVDKSIKQRGSNITEERLRIDFMCDHKLTDEEKKKVEDWVNEKIQAGLNVIRREMPLSEAEKIGAEMEFGAKYPEVVSVYFIEDENGTPISKEFCGGPHVNNTKELGIFKIQKEEAVSAGVRRIKAVLS